jgi:2-methylcitrate dehydratase PrpD
MGVTEEKLSKFIADYPMEGIPPEILQLGKRLFMSHLAVAIYSSREPALDILLDLYKEEGGRQRASILGTGTRTNLLNAALANGFLGHFEDFDDTHLATSIHASSAVLPAPFALGESLGLHGRKFLAAGVIGIEVACRIGNTIYPHAREAAEIWHRTSFFGVFGAAAAAARLLGLAPAEIEHALGIAGSQVQGLQETFGSMTKPLQAGRAAQNGLLAALLAQRGLTSITAESLGILEGDRGLAVAMAEGYDLADVTKDLGERWHLPDIAIKPHACGQANHTLIDSMLALREIPGVNAEVVKKVDAKLGQTVGPIVTRRHPEKGLEGKFSYQHGMSVALVFGNAYPQQFTDAKVNDPVIKGLRDRIDVTEDRSLPRRTAVVTMTLEDGRSHTVRTDHSAGTPGNPMTDDQIEAKFRTLVGDVLPEENVDRATELLWSLERVRSMRRLVAELSPIKQA